MKTAIENKICQNLSKLQDKIEEARRETGWSGEDSQPLRLAFCAKRIPHNTIPPILSFFPLVPQVYKSTRLKPYRGY